MRSVLSCSITAGRHGPASGSDVPALKARGWNSFEGQRACCCRCCYRLLQVHEVREALCKHLFHCHNPNFLPFEHYSAACCAMMMVFTANKGACSCPGTCPICPISALQHISD